MYALGVFFVCVCFELLLFLSRVFFRVKVATLLLIAILTGSVVRHRSFIATCRLCECVSVSGSVFSVLVAVCVSLCLSVYVFLCSVLSCL